MTDSHTAFGGSIPAVYERILRPVLFEPYALDLAERAEPFGGALLELACGTGVLTRRLLERAGPEDVLTATDLNPPMLEEAKLRVGEDPRLEWHQADMTALPFEDESFTAVVCQFGFMFPPDKTAIFREARRVLRPGGSLLFNVWDSLEQNPANLRVLEALEECFPGNPPDFLKVPFGFHDVDHIRSLMDAEGFESLRVESLSHDCRCPSAAELAMGLVRGTPLFNDLQARGADLTAVQQAIATHLAAFGGAAPFSCPMKAFVIQGVAE